MGHGIFRPNPRTVMSRLRALQSQALLLGVEAPVACLLTDGDLVAGTGFTHGLGFTAESPGVSDALHAEVMALAHAARHVPAVTIQRTVAYVTRPPCAACAAALQFAGVVEVVVMALPKDDTTRWAQSVQQARRFLPIRSGDEIFPAFFQELPHGTAS